MTSNYGVEPAPSPTRSGAHIELTVDDITKFAARGSLLEHSELVFALVRTLGANTSAAMQELKSNLAASGFAARVIKLRNLLEVGPFQSEADRYDKLMTAGDMCPK